ncbi:MOSC domain containing protein [Pyrenophora tritici-repentis]|uniref:MOSC domain containing protein n=2 Tax=Pyrenophora tritici-repentis TaxID=45151 RepID=A0A2W1DZU2_9PLEO|nr:MOSC domain containing protein [Pyrenophora tritici-repentis Pt-1C-BFP]KAA8622313.1 MOSC domain-containing protein [Pyrenophora tritici-repentis]EDU44233.1 MOSC domain containing protein [Pyrenophora tritici-repentis Pt-1C-BFP]KAF7451291.1 hypothetical protein A1F99_030680 [Pyrenophora tritici-repentis]KAF7575600.1 MOSC domain containing protein [Pyrenophora tritici-repentis]KAG9385656.1 MOSC domain containing protein [Pyrenophora tritici-repentis]
MADNAFEHMYITAARLLSDAGIDIAPQTLLITALAAISPFIILIVIAVAQSPKALPPPAGCRKLGLQGTTYFEDQYSKKYAKGGDPTPAKPWTVKALFVYPLKSAAPIELDKSKILLTGLKYDRQFTLAQQVTSLPSMDGKVTSEWHFMTQRKFPRLAKVETEIWVPDPSARDYKEDGEWVKSDGCLVIRFPFSPDTDFSMEGLLNYGKILAARLSRKPEPMLEFMVPFNPPQERIKSKGYRSEVLRIWKDNPVALNMSSEIDREVFEKLRYTLGAANPIALFRIDTNAYREVHKCAPKKYEVGFQTVIGMQDSYPIHIINMASIHDVASKLPTGKPEPEHIWQRRHTLLDALRFRANIYITGPPAFAEDDWKKAKLTSSDSSSLKLHISCRSTRCKLPNVDPKTAVADRNEPLTTLRNYRVIDAGSKNACLGMQVTPLEEGSVAVGDQIEVLETGEHLFIGGEGPKVDG